MLIVIYAVCRK